MSLVKLSKAPTWPLINDYGPARDIATSSPSWALVGIPLGRPVSYSRRYKKALGSIVSGAYSRKTTPVVITDDCVGWSISNTKTSNIKNFNATLRPTSGTNYLSQNALLPGDWIMFWAWNNQASADSVLGQIRQCKPANSQNDGLKFLGRVHSIRKRVDVNPSTGTKSVGYALQGVGFYELESQFYYDMALADSAFAEQRLGQVMAKLNLKFTDISNQEQLKAGQLKDNSAYLISQLIDLVLGSSAMQARVNDPAKKGFEEDTASSTSVLAKNGIAIDPRAKEAVVPSPQVNDEAPFSYLVPKTVGLLLGFPATMASKAESKDLFGYADILQSVIGVQKYTQTDSNIGNFFPDFSDESKGSRWKTDIVLKGTFLPVYTGFVNRPLWEMLDQFQNRAINEKFTSLRITPNGILPTLVVRQIPFSSESIQETSEFPLTKFMNLPRWQLDPSLITSLDIGRSDDTHVNLVHIYGEAATTAKNYDMQTQMILNAPIFDEIDMARNGVRGLMQTVACHFNDQLQAPKEWMNAIADWSFGSQYTLNGSVQCHGIQAPIAEGDNLELEDLVYHIESVMHAGEITPDGKKHFQTTLSLSNGMPIDQSDATLDYPRYPGFSNLPSTDLDIKQDGTVPDNKILTQGDDLIATSLDPGTSGEH
jgi:hypothetical protein